MKPANLTKAAFAAVLAWGAPSGTWAADLGTDASTPVHNRATIGYSVNSVNQTVIESSPSGNNNPGVGNGANTTFRVDRKVNLDVTEAFNAGVAENVTPGSSNQVLAFDVHNLTNDTVDLHLSYVQDNTDDFDATTIRVFVDNEAGATPGSWGGDDSEITSSMLLDDVTEDDSQRVFIVANIPSSAAHGDLDKFTLTARASEADGTDQDWFTESAGDSADPDTVDTTLADGTGVSDGARDGRDSDDDSYRAHTATLTVTKSARLISDPVNGGTNPKRIPGAVIEYCITVVNSGGADADSVAISDDIDELTLGFVTDSGRTGAANCSTYDGPGTPTGSYAGGVVSVNLGTIAAGATERFQFRVTID